MANSVTEINGVTKREILPLDVYEYNFYPIATITAKNSDNEVLFVVNTIGRSPSVLSLDFSTISPNYGATTPEEYCDQLALRGVYFSPVALPDGASSASKQDAIISAIQFSDEGFGERYMAEVINYQATAQSTYYGALVIRLKASETRNVFLQHIAFENRNSDDYQILVLEYDRGQIPSVLNGATISYQDIGESCEFSVVTQPSVGDGEIITKGIKKDGLWVSRNSRSGHWSPKILANPNKEYLLAIETINQTGADIYLTSTILEKPL